MSNYRSNFDHLGNRIDEELTSESYALDLIEALIIAAVLAVPLITYWGLL